MLRVFENAGIDTAWYVMLPFFDVDLEERRPVER